MSDEPTELPWPDEPTTRRRAGEKRIADLEAEVARCNETIGWQYKGYAELEAKVAHLNRECQTWEDRSIRAEAEVARLRAENAAMWPLVKHIRERVGPYMDESRYPGNVTVMISDVRLKDVRAAVRAGLLGST